MGNVRYYRMNPTISIGLDETDDQKLDQLINETDSYIEENVKLLYGQ